MTYPTPRALRSSWITLTNRAARGGPSALRAAWPRRRIDARRRTRGKSSEKSTGPMTTLIRIFDENGRETRRCDARCHRADPFNGESRCCCGGRLRGLERLGFDPLEIDPDYLQLIRETVTLRRGESVQLRIGA